MTPEPPLINESLMLVAVLIVYFGSWAAFGAISGSAAKRDTFYCSLAGLAASIAVMFLSAMFH